MVTRCSVVLMTQSGSVSFFFVFFLIELNRQFTLISFLTKSSRSSAGRSLDQLSPPHRGPSCTLHPTCAPCTSRVALVGLEIGGWCWKGVIGLAHCWLILHTDTHTYTRRDRQASPLYRFHSLTLLRSRGDARAGSRWGWRPVGAVRRW